MTKIFSYKYINLLGRILIGLGAFVFIVFKIQDEFLIKVASFKQDIQIEFLLITLVFMFFNWGIEAIKWKYSISTIQKIDFIRAFKLTLTGITLGIITPNRIGEIPARALLLNNKTQLKELVVKTSVAAFSQLIITFLWGVLAFFYVQQFYTFPFNTFVIKLVLIVLILLLLTIYFSTEFVKRVFYKISYFKKKELLDGLIDFNFISLAKILLLSFLRYLVFFIQYYLVLRAFGIQLSTISELFLIPFCFMIASIIPTLVISEIGVRGSVAIFIFAVISDNDVAILLASILLWIINVATPALIGLLFINRLKLVTK